MVTQVGQGSHILLETIAGKCRFPGRRVRPWPCYLHARPCLLCRQQLVEQPVPKVNISCRDGPAKEKLERNVGGGRGEIQAPPRARTGFWALPATFSTARAPAVTPPPRLSLQLTTKAHHNRRWLCPVLV